MKIPESVIEAAKLGFARRLRLEDALIAALAGWERLGMVLVPRNPTAAMCEAGLEVRSPGAIYRVMITAGGRRSDGP